MKKNNRKTFLMSFSKYSQYPVVSRISANDIKNVNYKFYYRYILSTLW